MQLRGYRSKPLITGLIAFCLIGLCADAGRGQSNSVVEVVNDGARVYAEPRGSGRRLGAIGAATRVRMLALVEGEDCEAGWAQIGVRQFVCSRHLRPSTQSPGGEMRPQIGEDELLPHRYAFVAFDGTRLFKRPRDYFLDRYFEAMGQGFGLIVRDQVVVEGVPFLRTRRGLWVERGALRFAQPSTFRGVEVAENERLNHAWVLDEGAPVQRRAGGAVDDRAGRHEIVRVETRRGGWARLEGGGMMRRAQLAEATLATRPNEVGRGELWIDVDTAEQVLTLYRGDRPRFVTLVSSGRGGNATPKGTFRIWAKLAYSDMDDLTRPGVTQNYAIEAVPWVQYFKAGVGLHATFWHDDFGRPRSHGCVNLSPTDARRLFGWTTPRLPEGWTAVLPRPEDAPTLVRVR